MLPRVREFYGLEKLWEEAEPPVEAVVESRRKASARARAAR
jgi:hypothetical protein